MSNMKKTEKFTLPDGKVIQQGDLIKVSGEYGTVFRFMYFVENLGSGRNWIDCFELYRGTTGPYRSFDCDRIKRVPKKRVKK
jgi:hypothetical protein